MEPMNLPPDRQREHQANERTFLAWLRTSIALIGFGFAIARFSLFLRQLQANVAQDPRQVDPVHALLNAENLGLLLVVFGVLMIGLSAWRYNQVLQQIEQGNFRPSRLVIWMMAGVVALFGLLSIPLVLWRNRTQETPPLDLPE